MSNISISWHMICRGHLEETTLAVNSLQGLYDKLIIAVDDRDDSDEVYEVLKHYSNIIAYRQHFDDFARYDLARQDVLDRVPSDTSYVGWSDSDEILVSDPYKVRKWLSETQPDAVNCGIHYIYPIGGHVAGQTYRNGRVRIWKHGTRVWSRPCHEYPSPINGIDNPVMGDVIFNHIKEDNKEYRADHHIELMQKEIDSGNIGWIFFQAKEYEFKGDIENAKLTYIKYLVSRHTNNLEEAIVKVSEMFLKDKQYQELIDVLTKLKIEHPQSYEYLAIAFYWNNNKSQAHLAHEAAKKLDITNKYPHLEKNDEYFKINS
jgi:hypothetical protein